MEDQLVSIHTIVEALGRSKASVYRDIKRGAFPKQVKIGGSSRWRLSEVDRFIAGL
ncbi:AlpA family phage regulatory protein [Tropicimonas sp. TH_r6]|uniref:helix-turn-helix transcriptional regulator n=1 Tax=Tropicimonas sp. TH_r6 TaxID=3082085 RepID=UPI0029549B00|nr:AlpA family phage regulatory protein [Tropicimonas sp. TH_r6]MDV7143612.1 AlpA family phage regulatory protein [Tropicimonas sp. TH_r6]